MFYEIVSDTKNRILKDMLLLVTGCIIMSVGISVFLVPNRLAAGGVSGIGIIIYYLSGMKIPVGVTMMVLNIPLFLVSLKKLGRYFIFKTILGAVLLSLFTDIVSTLYSSVFEKYFKSESSDTDLLLYAICGGVIVGAGLGLVYLIDGTTGGSDLLAKVITLKNRHSSIGRILLVIDAAIVFAATIVFGSVLLGIYAFISIYITTKTIDNVLEGFHFAKGLFIISEKSAQISEYILFDLGRGATSLYAKGMYTEKDSNVIMCVVKRKQLPKIKENIRNIDPKAFIMITDVREVFGEGF
jgi:uncharacterized membrane-anchored protein YitT (DUF2179 family)